MDNVHIGLTSSNGVTFTQEPTGSGSACQPTCWFDLPKSAPPTAFDPQRHRQRSIALSDDRSAAEEDVAGQSAHPHRPGDPQREVARISQAGAARPSASCRN